MAGAAQFAFANNVASVGFADKPGNPGDLQVGAPDDVAIMKRQMI